MKQQQKYLFAHRAKRLIAITIALVMLSSAPGVTVMAAVNTDGGYGSSGDYWTSGLGGSGFASSDADFGALNIAQAIIDINVAITLFESRLQPNGSDIDNRHNLQKMFNHLTFGPTVFNLTSIEVAAIRIFQSTNGFNTTLAIQRNTRNNAPDGVQAVLTEIMRTVDRNIDNTGPAEPPISGVSYDLDEGMQELLDVLAEEEFDTEYDDIEVAGTSTGSIYFDEITDVPADVSDDDFGGLNLHNLQKMFDHITFGPTVFNLTSIEVAAIRIFQSTNGFNTTLAIQRNTRNNAPTGVQDVLTEIMRTVDRNIDNTGPAIPK